MANLGALLHLEGRTIGGCRLIRRLGAGGMGEVYLAEQMRLGNRRVAVKIVRPDDDSGQDYRDAARRFLHEGRMLAGFAHPNVLPVHDSGVEDGCFYLVMEYAPDGSLKDAISGRGPHPLSSPVEVSLAVEIVVQIASALQYTHDRGIVHGDVKPGNVLVEMESDGHRRMLLADYGVARDLEATAQISLVTGTVAYMAPEQFSGGFSPASDQYALAVVAYQLLAGHPPFEGGFAEQMRGHLDLAPPSLRGANPAVPRSVEAVIRRGLAKEPSARYPTVLAFADALVLALRPETENTIFGAPGAWDATITMRPALANRRQQPARARAERPPVRMHRTHQPPDSDGHVFFANESATEQFPYAAPTTRHLDQRRIGVFATCAALLLVAMLVAIGTNGAAKTHALAPDTQDIALGGHPKATTTTTPGQSPTPTATPRSTPNAIENDLTGDAFTVAGISAPSSVAPGQPITASITLVNSGFNTWTAVGGYRLTCDGLHPHTAHSNCPSGFSVSLGQVTVSPGASITFVITLKAPGASGAYNAWLSMAHGNALFSTMPALLSLAVQVPAPTATPVPPATTTPQPTNTPTPQPTNTPTPQPTNTPTPQPTNTPTPQPTNTPTPQPTNTPTPQPTPTNTPVSTPTAQATDTPQPTSTVQSTDPPADTGTPSAAPATATRSLALWLAV